MVNDTVLFLVRIVLVFLNVVLGSNEIYQHDDCVVERRLYAFP